MAYFCAPTQSRVDPEMAMKLYKEGCTDKEICKVFCVSYAAVSYWRKCNNLPPNPPRSSQKEKSSEPYLANIKKCEKCVYQCNISGTCFCNYLLDTGKRRVYEGSRCKSYKKRRVTNE